MARFEAAAARHARRAASQGQPLVIGTHGMAPTVWLTTRVRLLPDPGAFWSELRFPDVIEVDLVEGTARPRR